MSGKTKQANRTKNNVRPSSSGRSAELLSSSANPSLMLVGPGNLLPALFPSLAGPTQDRPIGNEFLLCFKKFHKKDPITKLKALNELNELVAKSEKDEVVAALASWAHYYPTLTVDMDRKVREATQTVHGAFVRACGRQAAPQLKRLLPAWLMAQHDDHAPAMRLAHTSLHETFPNQKLAEAITFCRVEICNLYMDNLKGNAEYMLGGKKAEEGVEREEQRARVVGSTLRALRLLLHALPAARWLHDALRPLLCASAFWTLAAHNDPHVRAAFYSLVGAVSELGAAGAEGAELGAEARRAARELVARAEPAPAAARARAAELLKLLLRQPNFLDLIDKKVLEKRLLEIFENAAWGEAQPLAAALPELLRRLPDALATDQFYDNMFAAIFKGLRHVTSLSNESEREHWACVIEAAVRQAAARGAARGPALAARAHRAWLRRVLDLPDGAAKPALLATTAAHMAALVAHWRRAAKEAADDDENAETAVREFWLNVRSATAADLEKSPAGKEVVKSIDAHLQLLIGLKRTLDELAPADAGCERCLRDLQDAADEVVGRVLLFAHSQQQVPAVLSAAIPALRAFRGPSLLAALVRRFEVASPAQLYERVFRPWLADAAQRCEPAVDLLFLLLDHLREDEQDALFESFEELPPEVTRWCLSRAVSAAGAGAGAARWLRSAAAARALAALARRPDDGGARDLLLAALDHTRHDEVVISDEAIHGIVEACTAMLSEVVAGGGGAGAGRVRLAARAARALAGARAAAAMPLLLALFRLTLHVPSTSPELGEAWGAALRAWADGARRLPPAPRQLFVRDALDFLYEHLFLDTETLDIARIDHVVSLCPHLLEGGGREAGGAGEALAAQSRRLLERAQAACAGCPLEPYALQLDAVWGDLSCPFDGAAAAPLAPLAPAALLPPARALLFRAGYLRALLPHNTDVPPSDAPEAPPAAPPADADSIFNLEYFREQLCNILYDYSVLNVLYDHYAFWEHYDIIREAKERLDGVVPELVAAMPAGARAALAGALRAAARRHGYYWAYALYYYERAARAAPLGDADKQDVDASDGEPEQTDGQQAPSSSFEILESLDYTEADLGSTEAADAKPEELCSCHGLPDTPRETFAALLAEPAAAAGAPGPRYRPARAPLPPAQLASACQRAANFRDFLGELVLKDGYYHIAQMKALEVKKQKLRARAKFEEQQDAALVDFEVNGKYEICERWVESAETYARLGVVVDESAALAALAARERAMLRAYCALHAAAAPAAPVDQLLADLAARRPPAALDAVINGYYRHNDTMLFERSLAGASWLQLSATAGVLDALAAAVGTRGWHAPALHWDFTNIALCSSLASLALSLRMWTDDHVKFAMVARPALQLFVCVRQFVRGVRRECARRPPSDHVAALPREWADIFAPDATNNIYLVICHVLETGTGAGGMTAARAAVLAALAAAARALPAAAAPAARAAVGRAARAAARALAGTAHHGLKYLAYYTLRALAPTMIAMDEEVLAAAGAAGAAGAEGEAEGEGEGEDGALLARLSLALYHHAFSQLHDLVDAALAEYTVCESSCEVAVRSDSGALALGHLLLAAALLAHCRRAAGDLAVHYVAVFNKQAYAERILCAALRLLPAGAARYMAGARPALPRRLLPAFMRLQLFDIDAECSSEVVSRLACGVVLRALGGPGAAAARGWWAVLAARPAAALARLVAAAVAPALLNHQLAEVQARAADLGPNVKVSVSYSARTASCTLPDEQGAALRVSLAAAHPLTAPRVTSAAPGVDAHLFTRYLVYRNGRVIDAMKMWVEAVEGGGVDGAGGAGRPCYVCYCRAHPADRTPPAVACRQCRNYFHSRCIRRWFATSNRSNCPVCRTHF